MRLPESIAWDEVCEYAVDNARKFESSSAGSGLDKVRRRNRNNARVAIDAGNCH